MVKCIGENIMDFIKFLLVTGEYEDAIIIFDSEPKDSFYENRKVDKAEPFKTSVGAYNQAFCAQKKDRDGNNTNGKTVIEQESPPLSDQDLSYSERDEYLNNSDQSDTFHAKTIIPNTIVTDSTQKQSIITNDIGKDNLTIPQETMASEISNKLPPEEILYDITQQILHKRNVNIPIT
jgi:hypothetical protein